ncbi:MAG TPA: class I SAM-dependent methyltransferase [Pyrinomonadaceae bacterium]|jgi:ubiquinone/menaquinone biosynthesis C-methylase UbiE
MSYVERIKWRLGYTLDNTKKQTEDLFWSVTGKFNKPGPLPSIKILNADGATEVDSFWGEHIVDTTLFKSALQSKKHLEWRASLYPLFTEFMNLYGNHDNEVVLDYGCGPGNDLVGYSIYTNAKKIIGIDISAKALRRAQHRLSLHHVDPERIQLIQSSDTATTIPLEDASVDYMQCLGVLHHTSYPEALLKEFHRIMRPGAEARVMVYNRDSVWLHLHGAYEKLIIQNAFPGKNVYEIFHQTVDIEADGTGKCPIARCHNWEEFSAICEQSGFRTEYLGGYLSDVELGVMKKYLPQALHDERLAEEHRSFLASLKTDENGFPMYEGKHAGIGSVYRLFKK